MGVKQKKKLVEKAVNIKAKTGLKSIVIRQYTAHTIATRVQT